jgi:uncharacterized membrane protein
MNWSRRYTIRSYLRSTVWTAPVIALVLEQITFRIAYYHGIDFGGIPGFVIGRSGTIALADYVISSSIAFIVFTFSSLIVAIQVASGQLSPRIIATTLLRDGGIRGSVALFVYALLLAIAVKTRIDTIPRFVSSMTGILGLLSVIVFMFLIDHAARLLRPVNIVWQIAQQGLQVLEEVYPNPVATSPAPPRAVKSLIDPTRTVLHQDRSAIIIAVNVNALLSRAARADSIIELIPRVGDFVAKGDPLFRLRGGREKEIDERFLRAQVAFGRERTIEQDSTFAFRVIVDVAIKALSPAINDPTTAVLAIDQLQRLLHSVGRRDLRDEGMLDSRGELRLIFHTPNWNDFVDLTFSEIRMYGAGNLQIVRRLRSTITQVLQDLPQRRRELLRRELELLDSSIERVYALPEDLRRARIADSQGLGGASGNALELS